MNDRSFSSLGLSEHILAALATRGYDSPTPIQSASIPSLLEGKDLLGCAQTGTGKTAAFALPIIQRLSKSATRPQPRGCRALVVAPTRELAAQIAASFAAYGAGSRLTHACVFGGVGKSPQVSALARGVDVLVATPGRLLDLHSEGQARLDRVEIVVLDEADRMLDMGFIRDVKKIIALLPRERQTLLFSATMPSDIAGLANSILRDPVRVSVTPDKPAVELIDQQVAFVEKAEKRGFLTALIKEQEADRAIVFTRTKHGADRLARSLSSAGIPAEAIHANKSQNRRTRTMDDFRSGSLRVLVATDLAARGIDVDGVSHVYNYELPEVAETYVHRIGRTARAGAEGSAVALCDSEEKPLLRAIEKLMRKSVPVLSGEAFDRAVAEGKKGAIADAAAKATRGSSAGGRSDAPFGRQERGGRGRAEPRAAKERDSSRGSGRGGSSGSSRGSAGGPDRGSARGGARAFASSSSEAPRKQAQPSSRPRRPEPSRTGRAASGSGGSGERFSIEDVTGYNSSVGGYSRRR